MADEIETTAQLVDRAVLREIVVHEIVAYRSSASDDHEMGLPPEELHAPGCPEDEAALSIRTHSGRDLLGVRCRIETCNAYASFAVDAEVIFDIPGLLSVRYPQIIGEFTEQVGVTTVFPYLRAAVASLAALLSVPASPLPLLGVDALTFTDDDGVPDVEDQVSEHFMRGVVTRTTEEGNQEEVAEFFLDGETGTITRIGGEGNTPDLDELLNAIADLPPADEMTWEWMIRRSSHAAVRQAFETLREDYGDAATDLALAEIDEAAASIEAAEAFESLNAAIGDLDIAITAAQKPDTQGASARAARGRAAPQALLDAAERVRDSWERMRSATSN
ncbi:hypothetical protein A5633_07955 [Mycolicibacterium elephantis]|uniref:hypothetical protein n=1 Tax=Mycolicibacterium elephantis TaxID=81858 RepID=UPI0007EB791E|nr:hypothetical protein [Mycolicibacterium elephantis]OBA89088.1 hypothetical protein A5633_07955 [Mycolicibacterium elephantis]